MSLNTPEEGAYSQDNLTFQLRRVALSLQYPTLQERHILLPNDTEHDEHILSVGSHRYAGILMSVGIDRFYADSKNGCRPGSVAGTFHPQERWRYRFRLDKPIPGMPGRPKRPRELKELSYGDGRNKIFAEQFKICYARVDLDGQSSELHYLTIMNQLAFSLELEVSDSKINKSVFSLYEQNDSDFSILERTAKIPINPALARKGIRRSLHYMDHLTHINVELSDSRFYFDILDSYRDEKIFQAINVPLNVPLYGLSENLFAGEKLLRETMGK